MAPNTPISPSTHSVAVTSVRLEDGSVLATADEHAIYGATTEPDPLPTSESPASHVNEEDPSNEY